MRPSPGGRGPLENRARFLLEVVRRTRATIGPSAALAVKLNSADFQRGGFGEDDAAQVAAWLEAEGVDLLEVSGGTYPGLPRDLIAGSVERSPVAAPGSRWAAVDALVEAGWYGLQLARIAGGVDPDPGLPRWRAIVGYLGDEARHAARRAVPTLP